MSKTTMSVSEMRRLLGLGKTDSYWLVHQGLFETILVNGKMRIVLDSFEAWYAMQTKHKKVTGEEPGLQLKAESLSMQDIGELLGLCADQALAIVKRFSLPYFKVHSHYRVPREDFERWYAVQSHYRKVNERDKTLEATLLSLPQMGRLLGVERDTVYSIIKAKRNNGMFNIISIADKRYVTRESFNCWLAGQSRYSIKHAKTRTQQLYRPRNPDFYTVEEVCRFYGFRHAELYRKLKRGDISAVHIGSIWRIPRAEFDKLMKQEREE